MTIKRQIKKQENHAQDKVTENVKVGSSLAESSTMNALSLKVNPRRPDSEVRKPVGCWIITTCSYGIEVRTNGFNACIG